jgi:hypothetical protein
VNAPNTKQVVLYSQHNSAFSMQKKPSSQSSSIAQVIFSIVGDADGVGSEISVSETIVLLGADVTPSLPGDAGAGVAVGVVGAFGDFGALGALGDLAFALGAFASALGALGASALGALGASALDDPDLDFKFLFVPCENDEILLSPSRYANAAELNRKAKATKRYRVLDIIFETSKVLRLKL